MGLAIWMCVLCLQAGLLSHALDCSGTAQGQDCVTGRNSGNAGEQYDNLELRRPLPLSGTVGRQTLGAMRRRRHLERGRTAHQSQSSQPGAVSVKGFPNTLIQADRARRHLAITANTKKGKRKSRVGSFSLLSNDPSVPLQISRARRQVKSVPPKKGKSRHSGAYSVLGDPQNEGQNDRARRNVGPQ